MSKSQVSLRSLSPKLYQYITEKLFEDYHIHSFDVQIDAEEKEEGIHIILRFGEYFTHSEEHFCSSDSLEKDNDKELDEFIDKTGEECKQVLIDDYYRMMTP
jgi:hypothetical protein